MALGMAAMLESLPWLLSPDRMRETMAFLINLPPEKLRVVGLAMLAGGLALCAFGNSLR